MARRTGRPILVDINILPPELRPAGLSRAFLILLGLSALALASLLFAFQLRWGTQTQINQLESRLRAAQDTIGRFASAQQEASQLQGRVDKASASLKELQEDYQAFKTQRVSWSAVMATIVENGTGVGFTSVKLAQTEAKGTLEGIASSSDTVAAYARSLVDSNLFTKVTIRSITVRAPEASPSPTPGGPGPTATPAPGATPTPQATPTPEATPSPTPQPVPTPAYDYVIVSARRTSYPLPDNRYSIIKGRVLDREGRPVPGLRFRVQSCCPPWQAEYPPPSLTSDGTFEFVVGRWIFDVFIVGPDGSLLSEMARGLDTDGSTFTGYHVWNVVFQQRGAQPAPQAVTPTPEPELPYLPPLLPNTGNQQQPEIRAWNQDEPPEPVFQPPVSFIIDLEIKVGAE